MGWKREIRVWMQEGGRGRGEGRREERKLASEVEGWELRKREGSLEDTVEACL